MPLDREKIVDIIIGAGDPPDRTPRYAPRLDRRNFIKWGIAGLVGAAVLDYEFGHAPRNMQKAHEAAQNAQEGQAAIEGNKSLETKYFAEDIVQASVNGIPLDPEIDGWGLLAGIFAGTTLGQTILRVQPEMFNRVIGLGAGLVARTFDDISTFVAASALNDPRIKEYGLDAYFYENRTALPADLTPKALLDSELVSTLELAGITLAFPLIGKIYATIVPFVFKNNLDVAQMIVNSLNLGDQVKAMIQEGKSGKEISTYLSNVGKKQDEHQQHQRQAPQEHLSQ